MKKVISIILSAVMLTSIFTALPLSSSAAKKKAEKVSLKKSSATLKISEKNGKKVYGAVTIKVKKAKGVKVNKITYKSSNKKIAAVSKKGKVTAKKKGDTKIKVTVKYKYKKRSYKKTLTFKVKVKNTVKESSVPAATATVVPETTEASTAEQTTAPIDSTEAVEDTTAVEPTTESQEKTEPETSTEVEETTAANYTEATESTASTQEAVIEPTSVQPATRATESIATFNFTEETTEEPYVEPKSRALNTVPEDTAASETFSAEFYGKLSSFSNKLYAMACENEKGNYAMSPLSAYMALAMLYNVGDEGVKSDIESLVGMNEADIEKTGALFKSIEKRFKFIDYFNGNEEIELGKVDLTNSIWIDDNDSEGADADTLNTLAEKLYCNAFSTPFKDDNDAANSAVRKFIKEQTNGLIDQNFKLDTATVFALINTLYFKDVWDLESEELPTSKMSFTTDNGVKECEFLNGDYLAGQIQETDSCYYFYTETEAGYKVKFVLPKDGYTLAQAMTADNLDKVNSQTDFKCNESGKYHLTRCVFPSFKIASDTELEKVLANNNELTNAFNAFYSPLFENRPLMISKIKHKTVIDVNTKGVEGAAVTIIVGNDETAPDMSSYVYHTLTMDRNFGFIITDPNDVVMFEGQVKDPTLSE